MAAVAYHRNRVPSAAGMLTALPLADGSLAAAVVFYAVIHLDDAGVAAAAGELARVLRPGGVALVSIHIGDEVRHVDEWHGEPVDLDFRFLHPAGSAGCSRARAWSWRRSSNGSRSPTWRPRPGAPTSWHDGGEGSSRRREVSRTRSAQECETPGVLSFGLLAPLARRDCPQDVRPRAVTPRRQAVVGHGNHPTTTVTVATSATWTKYDYSPSSTTAP
jgi:SAM-dependent methyltransferase